MKDTISAGGFLGMLDSNLLEMQVIKTGFWHKETL